MARSPRRLLNALATQAAALPSGVLDFALLGDSNPAGLGEADPPFQ
jgi:hypothetical protein